MNGELGVMLVGLSIVGLVLTLICMAVEKWL